MMKETQENRVKSEVNESGEEEEEGVREAEEKKPLEAGNKSEALTEKQREVETVEIGSDEKEALTDEKSITTPPDDEASKEILEEAHNEPQENTLLYLQSEKVHVHNEKVESSTSAVDGENAPAERPPPVIDKSEGCCYEESEPGLKKERSRRKDARSIYWMQLQPWPEPLEVKKPPDPGLSPKEKKKIQGTYKNHKKKRADTLVFCPQKNQWIEKRRVNPGSLVEDHSHNSLPTYELIKLGRNSKPLGLVVCKGGNGN